MTTLLRCVNGHEFEVGTDSQVTTCPVCGERDRTLITPLSCPPDRPSLGLSKDSVTGLSAPPVLSRFEILEELGRGGMGVVYKAKQRDNGRIVALKVIRKERLSNPDMLSRFRREAVASARLGHPAIVQVYEADQDGDTPYLAIEYVPGITLQKLVEDAGPLPIARACEFVRQTAVGLEHAAEQRLVHRDIKPSNLMVVAPDGLPLPARPVIKILDMGVARLFQLSEQEASLTTLTRDGSVIGTPDYIAPEQLEDPKGVDIRADLYALGCTFYYLLTGQVPFPGGTLIQKLDRQRWQTPVAVNQLRSEVPPPLAAVVRRLMAKHPDDRYQTAGELAVALEALLRTGELPGGHATAGLVSLRVLTGHIGGINAVAFSPDGHSLVSGGADRSVRIWNAESGKERCKNVDGRQEVACLALVPTGVILVGQGVTVRGIDANNGRELFKLTGHNDAVRCLAVSGDGKVALSGSDDRTVRVWDIHRGREMRRFSLHKAGITGVALSSDGKLAISASRDQTIRIWETSAGKELRQLPAPRGPVLCVALTPDGTQVATGHFDTTIRLWEVATGRELRRFSGHRQMVGALACGANGEIVSASHDQTVRVWDGASEAETASGTGHTAAATAVALSPDGTRIVSAGLDQAIRVWTMP